MDKVLQQVSLARLQKDMTGALPNMMGASPKAIKRSPRCARDISSSSVRLRGDLPKLSTEDKSDG